MMKRWFAIVLLLLVSSGAACSGETVDALTYAVFPYVPDVEHYQEIVERRWAEIEPDIRLVRAEWNCYHDGAPEGIDVVMYDAIKRDALIEAGWIQPIEPDAVQNAGDIFPYALEGFTVDGRLYGIPAFLCGNFLIYDRECVALAEAEHITDLAGESGVLVINSEDRTNRLQYACEVLADTLGEANPPMDSGAEEALALIDRLAVDAHRCDGDDQVALAYDSGIGWGYIGFSESMRFLDRRISQTGIKAISFSDKENLPRVYADAVAVTGGAEGLRYEKSVELMNVMTEADILAALTVQDGVPQYLMLARRSPYVSLAGQFPIYRQIEALASNAENHVILGP